MTSHGILDLFCVACVIFLAFFVGLTLYHINVIQRQGAIIKVAQDAMEGVITTLTNERPALAKYIAEKFIKDTK